MADFKVCVKTVAAANGSERAAKALKRIFQSRRSGKYTVLPARDGVDGQAVLLMTQPVPVANPEKYAGCVAQYALTLRPDFPKFQNLITFSTECDGADFTARNIRTTPDGFAAFEIVGVGIIGRVRLKTKDTGAVETVLAAAAAAIAAGISFSEVLEALNESDSADW